LKAKVLKVKGLKHFHKIKGSLVLIQDRTVLWKYYENKAHIIVRMGEFEEKGHGKRE